MFILGVCPACGRIDSKIRNLDGETMVRKREASNRMMTPHAEAVLLAAEQVGEDGRGEGGLAGYLRNIAATEPKAYASLLGRVLPYQVKEEAPEKVYRSVEEV